MILHLERFSQQSGAIDVGVAMNLPVAEEAGVFQAGNQTQHSGLLTEFQVILKSDQVVRVGSQVLLTQLHDRVGLSAGAGILKTHRLHGAEAQRVAAATGNLFDGQTALEVIQFFPVALLDGLS